MNYHERLTASIIENEASLEWVLGFCINETKTALSLGRLGDIDIFVRGEDLIDGTERTAIIEIKSHSGLVPHYLRAQLPKYEEAFPSALQFVAFGDDNRSLKFETICFMNSSQAKRIYNIN